MFKVPKSIKSIEVLGIEVEIHLDQARCEHDSAFGLFDGEKIILREEYRHVQDFIKTLTHETMHAHCHIVGLQLETQVEEVIATTAERLFTTVTMTLHKVFHELEASLDDKPKKKKNKKITK